MINCSLEEISQFKIFSLLSLTNHLPFVRKGKMKKKRRKEKEKSKTWKKKKPDINKNFNSISSSSWFNVGSYLDIALVGKIHEKGIMVCLFCYEHEISVDAWNYCVLHACLWKPMMIGIKLCIMMPCVIDWCLLLTLLHFLIGYVLAFLLKWWNN